MLRAAHLVKIIDAPPASEWGIAQPVTFASLRAARAFSEQEIAVEHYAAHFPAEAGAVPDGFRPVRALDRDVSALGRFRIPRPLPLLRDVLDRLYEASDAEYLIYTNVDIALMPHFYAAIRLSIAQGHDAIVINRRTIPASPSTPADLPAMYATIGTPHPGFDCFVFRRELYPRFVLGDVCLGTGHVDLPLICSMIATCESFLLLTDAHLTFHLGDARTWKSAKLRDYRRHNDREASLALQTLAARAPRRLGVLARLLLRFHLPYNPLLVWEFRRVFSR